MKELQEKQIPLMNLEPDWTPLQTLHLLQMRCNLTRVFVGESV